MDDVPPYDRINAIRQLIFHVEAAIEAVEEEITWVTPEDALQDWATTAHDQLNDTFKILSEELTRREKEERDGE